jgi:hypothetical protein
MQCPHLFEICADKRAASAVETDLNSLHLNEDAARAQLKARKAESALVTAFANAPPLAARKAKPARQGDAAGAPSVVATDSRHRQRSGIRDMVSLFYCCPRHKMLCLTAICIRCRLMPDGECVQQLKGGSLIGEGVRMLCCPWYLCMPSS